MAEEKNPYYQQTADSADGQPTYPQQPAGYYQQPEQQPQYQQPQAYQTQPYPQQPYYGYAQKQPGGGAAKAFAIISFVVGCLSFLLVLFGLIILAAGSYSRNAAGAVFALTFGYGLIVAFPGMIFGIVSLAKKTRLLPLGVMGVLFNVFLLLEVLVSLIMILL